MSSNHRKWVIDFLRGLLGGLFVGVFLGMMVSVLSFESRISSLERVDAKHLEIFEGLLGNQKTLWGFSPASKKGGASE